MLKQYAAKFHLRVSFSITDSFSPTRLYFKRSIASPSILGTFSSSLFIPHTNHWFELLNLAILSTRFRVVYTETHNVALTIIVPQTLLTNLVAVALYESFYMYGKCICLALFLPPCFCASRRENRKYKFHSIARKFDILVFISFRFLLIIIPCFCLYYICVCTFGSESVCTSWSETERSDLRTGSLWSSLFAQTALTTTYDNCRYVFRRIYSKRMIRMQCLLE